MKKISLLFLLLFIVQHSNSQDWCRSGFADRTRRGEPKTFSLSLGYGTSYGGYGVQGGVYFTSERKVGVSVGIGYYFGDLFINGGVKFYIWETLYLNPKYGYFKRIYFYKYDEFSDVVEYKKDVIGPGFMVGYDWFLFNGIGVNVGGGVNYDNLYLKKIYPAIDIGVFISF